MSSRQTPTSNRRIDSPSDMLAAGTKSPVREYASDGRRRQAYRDDAIRKRINTSLSKRSVTSSVESKPNRRRPPPGTVLSLKPSPPLTMKASTTVFEAAQFMAAKRENCVLVVDDVDETVCGIFTAKDLAFRVVGCDLDAKDITIETIMTRNPMCAQTDTSATEALNLMVTKGFRHLPVMNENNDIAGVLDITKCYHEAMEKLERAYKSSRKLYDALEGVPASPEAAQIIDYVEALKKRMEGPNLNSVLDESTTPIFVSIKTNVYEAACLMKERNTTAVLVTEDNQITGIVTSKDIVLRVIAAGFNPKICSLVRVMTPQPDFASHTTTIQEALRKMHDGNYLNLPVMGQNSEIIGIVDVLTLTYATLEQINTMSMDQGESGKNDSEGPAWNRFWMSIDADDMSEHSYNSHTKGGSTTLAPEVSQSELAEFEIGPNDSVSYRGGAGESEMGINPGTVGGSTVAYDMTFPFKFKSPSGRTHRITVAPTDGLVALRGEVRSKLKPEELEELGILDENEAFGISYVDDEGDVIAITSDRDLIDAIDVSKALGNSKVDIYVHHIDDHESVIPAAGTRDKDTKSAKGDKKRGSKKTSGSFIDEELIPGIPNEKLILPGAITLLAGAIMVVFVFGRSSSYR